MDKKWKALYTEQIDFPPTPSFLQRAEEVDLQLSFTKGYSTEEIIDKGADCDALFILHARIGKQVLDLLPSCRVLARVGTGYDLIDVGAASDAGVVVTYVPDFCSDELSDTVMMFILSLARQLPKQWHAARDHRWMAPREVPSSERLRGSTLGILGFGNSGRKTAEKARAFGLDVRVWTRTQRPELFATYGVHHVSLEEVLQCDFVSVHLPSTPATRQLIGADALARMKPGAFLVNVARGDIVDTQALCNALQLRRLAGAGLDVVDPEPLPADHPMWDLENVIITPHTAALSRQSHEESFSIALEDVIALMFGGRPNHPVPEQASGADRPGLAGSSTPLLTP